MRLVSSISSSRVLSMQNNLLVSTRAKIHRANKHFNELKEAIEAFQASKPYRIVADKRSKPGYELYKIFFNQPIPDEWGGIVGDVIHNLRSSLDTLATALVIANGRTGKDIIQNTYFPIGASKEVFEQKLVKDLRGASPEARRMVERLKPYKGGTEAFWRLHKLDVLDKHTVLVPVGASHVGVRWQIDATALFNAMLPTPSGEGVVFPEMAPLMFRPVSTQYPLKDGDVIFSYGNGPDARGAMKGKFEFAMDIAFGEGQIVDGQPVIPTLQQFIDFTKRVVDIFERYA